MADSAPDRWLERFRAVPPWVAGRARSLWARLAAGARLLSAWLATGWRWLRARLAAGRRWFNGRAGRRVALGAALLLVTLAGISAGLAVAGTTRQPVGPFEARFSVEPSFTGGTAVELPPLGSVHLRSHSGPAHVTIDLASLDSDRTRELFRRPDAVDRVSASAVEDITQGVTRLALQATGAALLGAMVLAAIVFRSMRRVAACGGIALAVMVTSLAVGVRTFRQESIAEPTYEGLLINARNVVGEARTIADRYDAYREQLQRMVTNVSRLYTTFSTLPVEPPDDTIKVLHVSDLHLNPAAWSVIQTVVDQFGIDVVVDTGDITDWGSEPEASYVAEIGRLGVPYVYIRGNHDSTVTATSVAAAAGTRSCSTTSSRRSADCASPASAIRGSRRTRAASRPRAGDPEGANGDEDPLTRSGSSARRDDQWVAGTRRHRAGARPRQRRTARGDGARGPRRA